MGIVKTNKKIDFLISKYTEDHILTYPEDSNVIIFSTSGSNGLRFNFDLLITKHPLVISVKSRSF